MFASFVLLTAAAKTKEKKPIKTGPSIGHITNLKLSILETFNIYGFSNEVIPIDIIVYRERDLVR